MTDHDPGRQADQTVTHPAGFEPADPREVAAPRPARLAPRPDKGLPFAEALDEVAREHHGVSAALDDDPEFQRQMAAAEDASDLAAIETFRRKLAAGEEEFVPAVVVDRILNGESRVRVWRDHRGLSVAALAGQAGLEADRLDEVEAGTRDATVDELRRIATALGVTLDDLAG